MGKAALIIENCGKTPLLLRTVLVCMDSYEEGYEDYAAGYDDTSQDYSEEY